MPTPSERPCAGEWRDLIHWLKDQPCSPDFVIVQQVSGRAQADHLAKVMSKLLAGQWRAIVAEAEPRPFNSPCGPPKDRQTNAILYRPGAFEPIGQKRVFQTYVENAKGTIVLNDQARTKTVVQRFRDLRSGNTVSIASTHWATRKSGGTPKSALASMERVHKSLAASGGDLMIWGGDTNMSDLVDPSRASSEFRNWYRRALSSYRDAAHASCSGSKSCLIERHRTVGSKRIDFLMAAKKNGLPRIDSVHTIGFREAGEARGSSDDPNLRYSDHRAIRARIWY